MRLPPLTTIELKRANSLVFVAKEALEKEYSPELNHITEALTLAVYFIDEIVLKLERHEKEITPLGS